MFTKSAIAATVIAISASAASAMDAPSQGAAQLAALAGVEPGVYSVADLIRLNDVKDQTSQAAEVRFILHEGRSGIAGRADTGSVGANGLTTAEAALINEASKNSNDAIFARFVENGGIRDNSADVRSNSPAHVQLAGQLDVNPADFTLSQLIRLNDAAQENDRVVVAAILDEAGVDTPAYQVLR